MVYAPTSEGSGLWTVNVVDWGGRGGGEAPLILDANVWARSGVPDRFPLESWGRGMERKGRRENARRGHSDPAVIDEENLLLPRGERLEESS
jgi:hypothetical protein